MQSISLHLHSHTVPWDGNRLSTYLQQNTKTTKNPVAPLTSISRLKRIPTRPIMSSCDNQNNEMSEDAKISIETQLCELCSHLFSTWGDEGPGWQTHHEDHESLLRSLTAGCQFCEILKDGWDHFAVGLVHDPMCHSLIHITNWNGRKIIARFVSEAYSREYGESPPTKIIRYP